MSFTSTIALGWLPNSVTDTRRIAHRLEEHMALCIIPFVDGLPK
jgi:hypothetical protein